MAEIFGVVMAGGVGSRFWPRSREKRPKQLLEIGIPGTMIRNTVERLTPLIDNDHILVVTNQQHKEAVQRELPSIPPDNLLTEPVGRNTAPCIGLAALWVKKINPEALMVVLPADHLIQDTEKFLATMKTALHAAEQTDGLVTIGIQPTRPETGYGYIQIAEEAGRGELGPGSGVFAVKTFAEKPGLETAARFLESGDFLWNSGMFVWKAKVILEEMRIHLPDLYTHLEGLGAAIGSESFAQVLDTTYGLIRGVSIDYGVMEKAGHVYLVKGEFGWSDVGSWDEAARISTKDEEGNSLRGNVIMRDSKGSYVESDSRIVAAVGIEDLIVISTDDAVLICKKGRSQEVKEIVDYLRRKHLNDFL